MILPFCPNPIPILSTASSKSSIVIVSEAFLAASIAASFNKFARSAPTNPGVIFAISSSLTSEASFLFLACTFNIAILPCKSGASTFILLSNLPALSNAGSSTSSLFVAAITITFASVSKPSISTRSWFNVCSLSSLLPLFFPTLLFLPIASISSINIIEGLEDFAFSNKSLTLEAPTPTNISTNSDPEMLKNEAPDSPATAFASNVFPVPGLPSKSTPLGTLAPAFVYFSGFFRKSTTSFSSSLAPSTPATSSNFTSGFLSSLSALDLPKPKIFPGPPCPFPIIFFAR